MMAMIGIPELANELGTTPQKLRKFLRSNFARDDRGKKYEWAEDNFEVENIREKWKATGGSNSRREGPSRKSRRAAAISKGNMMLDLDPNGPIAPQNYIHPCSWCGSSVELVEVYVQAVTPEEDNKMAKYQCTKEDCGVEYDVVLTLGGWKSPDETDEVIRMRPLIT